VAVDPATFGGGAATLAVRCIYDASFAPLAFDASLVVFSRHAVPEPGAATLVALVVALVAAARSARRAVRPR